MQLPIQEPRPSFEVLSVLSTLSPGDLLSFPDGQRVLLIEEVGDESYIAGSVCFPQNLNCCIDFIEWSVERLMKENLVPLMVARDDYFSCRYPN